MAATNYSQTIKNDTKDFITTAILQLLGIQKHLKNRKILLNSRFQTFVRGPELAEWLLS